MTKEEILDNLTMRRYGKPYAEISPEESSDLRAWLNNLMTETEKGADVMTVTAKEMAEKLNGCQYGNEITRDEAQLAKESGLVVVYGYSDDNMELDGAIREEIGCYGGGSVYFTGSGLLEDPHCNEKEGCRYFRAAKKDSKEIKAVWCAPGKAAWTYETDIPHETFNVYEDDDLFCVGIVFSLEDLK